MKKALKICAGLLLGAAMFVSCSDDEDESASVYANLPASVGTNPFSGKTWKKSSTTLAFTDSKMTQKSSSTETVYNYTYNTEKNALYCGYVSVTASGKTISSIDDYVNAQKSLRDSSVWNDDMASYYRDEATAHYKNVEAYGYTLSSDGKTLVLKYGYFPGSLPSSSEFQMTTSSSSYKVEYDDTELNLWDSSSNKFRLFPSFSGNSFSGTVYQKVDGYWNKKIGTVSGTYSATGEGTSDCTLKIKFTSLPSALSNIPTNTEISLTQASGSSTTYTLSE